MPCVAAATAGQEHGDGESYLGVHSIAHAFPKQEEREGDLGKCAFQGNPVSSYSETLFPYLQTDRETNEQTD